MDPSPRKADITKLSSRYPSESKFQMYRNLSLGGSASCVLMVLTIFETQLRSDAVDIAIGAATIGASLWFGLSGIFEFYIILGRRSFPHYRLESTQALIGAVFVFAGIALVVAFGAVLYQMNSDLVWYLAGSAIFSIAVVAYFAHSLGRWWAERPTLSAED